MWPDTAKRPTLGLMLSVSASRPHTTFPPRLGVPSSAGSLPSLAAAAGP
jgi:hypothetical protein